MHLMGALKSRPSAVGSSDMVFLNKIRTEHFRVDIPWTRRHIVLPAWYFPLCIAIGEPVYGADFRKVRLEVDRRRLFSPRRKTFLQVNVEAGYNESDVK